MQRQVNIFWADWKLKINTKFTFNCFKGSKYVGLWRKGKMYGHGEIIHKNHKLVGKFKENYVSWRNIVNKKDELN